MIRFIIALSSSSTWTLQSLQKQKKEQINSTSRANITKTKSKPTNRVCLPCIFRVWSNLNIVGNAIQLELFNVLVEHELYAFGPLLPDPQYSDRKSSLKTINKYKTKALGRNPWKKFGEGFAYHGLANVLRMPAWKSPGARELGSAKAKWFKRANEWEISHNWAASLRTWRRRRRKTCRESQRKCHLFNDSSFFWVFRNIW